MAVPDFQSLMRPLLAAHEDGSEHEIAATRDLLADTFDLSAEDRAERIPSGRVTTLQNRVGWAAMYLFRAGLLERPRRAHYRITDRGRATLTEHPHSIDLGVLKQFEEFEEFRSRRNSHDQTESSSLGDDGTTAEERIGTGYEELRVALAAELLDQVRAGSWEFFEQLVLDVLKAMGYGGPEESVERLGGAGSDGGVDGVIREDALGLDLIYVQAKAWQKPVGRPEIQAFFGALHGKRASKGVFLTTSKFTPEAREFAVTVTPRMILIDGRELAELMIDYDVGVAVKRSIQIKGVNLEYFAEESTE
jgi:restriction system protein